VDHDSTVVVQEEGRQLLVWFAELEEEVVELLECLALGDGVLLLDTLKDQENLLGKRDLLLTRGRIVTLFLYLIILLPLLLPDILLR
jgi:hypothetical protein